MPKPPIAPGLPTRDQIMAFIEESGQPAGKREIARAFGLHGQEKIRLKALLKDMADEGLIDLGPEGGDKGGQIVVCGTPEEVAAHPTSHTGRYLAQVLQQHPPQALAA